MSLAEVAAAGQDGKASDSLLLNNASDGRSGGENGIHPDLDDLIPFRHLQIGALAGYSTLHMKLENGPGRSERTINRFFVGLQINPLAFIRLKGIASVPQLAETERTSTGQHRFEYSSRTMLRSGGVDASIMIPLIWNNGFSTLFHTREGLFLTVGGAREWVKISDSYRKTELNYGETVPLEAIAGTTDFKRWTFSTGLLYRKFIKGWNRMNFEGGVEYCPLFNKSFIAAGAGVDNVNISRTVIVEQKIPLRLSLSMNISLY